MKIWWLLYLATLRIKQQLVFWSKSDLRVNDIDWQVNVMFWWVVKHVVPSGSIEVCAQCCGDNYQ